MKLIDTSVWISHFRYGDKRVTQALDEDNLLIHPQIIKELAVGHIPTRKRTLFDLQKLPFAPVVSLEETLKAIEHYGLFGLRIGAVDVELLLSARLAEAELITDDKRLMLAWKRANL